MLKVAKGIKAHGIRGDIKINCLMDTPVSFSKLKEVIIRGNTYKIEKVRENGQFLLLKLNGVDTMEGAETFRDADIFSLREKMPTLDKNTFYIDDIMGAKVFIKEKEVGFLSDILQYGSADVYVITTSKGPVMFPNVEGVIEKVDIKAHIIYLDETEFEKVAVYED